MCGLVISAFVLSLFGALVQRGAAAALGVPARFVLGIGPRLGDREAPPRALEVRPVMLWSWVPLMEGGATWRRGLVRAVGPLAIVLLPFLVCVVALAVAGDAEDGNAVGRASALVGRVISTMAGDVEAPSAGPVTIAAAAREQAERPHPAQLVAVLAATWTTIALLWASIAAVSESVRAVRGRS